MSSKKAEVAFDHEDPREVWFPATVLKNYVDAFLVEYQKLGNGDQAVLHKATVDFWHIRPSPPHLSYTHFSLDDEVDVFYDYGWWRGVITKEHADNKYNVFFEHSKKEREFICSKVRPHLEWKHGEWYNERCKINMLEGKFMILALPFQIALILISCPSWEALESSMIHSHESLLSDRRRWATRLHNSESSQSSKLDRMGLLHAQLKIRPIGGVKVGADCEVAAEDTWVSGWKVGQRLQTKQRPGLESRTH
ncbi:agenet domain-containing protein [Tanacetum coccineum]